MKLRRALDITLSIAFFLSLLGQVAAQDITAATRLWVDTRTGQVFVRPGKGRVPLALGNIVDSQATEQNIEKKVEAKVAANTNSQINAQRQTSAQLEQENAALAEQINAMQPAWQSYVGNFQDKFRLGAVLFADYRFYTNTGFQPQEQENLTNPGPGNNKYNSFDITRAYLNFFFFPTDEWAARITPDVYKTIGSSNVKIGQTTGFASNLDGDLGVRLKYANLTYSGLWDRVPALKGGTLSFGVISNPFTEWEENLYGFRFVNSSPWNFLGLPSAQTGVSMEGTFKHNERAYLDYGIGGFTNANYHTFEQSDTKQFMVRGTLFPFGAKWRYDGLGITGFYNYGYGNTAPDTADIPTTLKGPNAHIQRIAALVHYTADNWGLAGEFDSGSNAFQASNLWSGSGPADAFGFPTGKAITSGTFAGNTCGNGTTTVVTGKLLLPCYPLLNTYGPQTAAWQAILNNGQAQQEGFDFFGHFHIPRTPITLFGMYQWFLPNTQFADDPLDFQRWVIGASYRYNSFLRFAIDTQNFSYYHGQQSIPASTLKPFGYTPGGTFNNQQLPKTGSIPTMVTRDTHSIFANVEFAY